MKSIVRVAGISNKIVAANPTLCCEEIGNAITKIKPEEPDIVVFPRLCLSGSSCEALFGYEVLANDAKKALSSIMERTANSHAVYLIGMPLLAGGTLTEVCAVIHRGMLVGYLSCEGAFLSEDGTIADTDILPDTTVFSCGSLRFCILPSKVDALPERLGGISRLGCDLIIVPSCDPATAGSVRSSREIAKAVSASTGCAVVVVNGGVGESSAPHIYQGFVCICEDGEEVAFAQSAFETVNCVYDIDADIVHAQRKRHGPLYNGASRITPAFFSFPAMEKLGKLKRQVPRNPFLPRDPQRMDSYCEEIFSLQSDSLALRMKHIGCRQLVLGISGGLDSTLALLVSVSACDKLGIPRENITAVTMPGFGTTDRTYFNALHLIEELGCVSRDISIRAAVTQHFEDISQDPANKDVTYENAQARERAQILLDIANQVGGLVVGTGDLSEEALGWCTFAGDHIANFNVNTDIPKTLIRIIVGKVANKLEFANVRDILLDILDTPVSPELLPPDETGKIQQKTEVILGSYELHDFFIYYFIRYRLAPSKLYEYACIAFEGMMELDYIREKLTLFLKRFITNQFKRSCSPDSAAIGPVSLTAGEFSFPSDISPAMLLKELNDYLETSTQSKHTF